MTSGPVYDCFHDRDIVEPYPDISGPGVLVGFLGPTYLSIFVLVVYYLVCFDPEAGLPLRSNVDAERGISPSTLLKPNPIDRIVLRAVRPLILKISGFETLSSNQWPKKTEIYHAFQRCISAMCDIQMLTGAGILSSGSIAMNTSYLSAYHWQMVAGLAWFANLTHLSGLTSLRGYLWRNPREKWYRIATTLILTLMLAVGMVPTGFFTFTTAHMTSVATNVAGSNDTVTINLEPVIANASADAHCFFDVTVVQKRLEDYRDGRAEGVLKLHETIAFRRMLISILLTFASIFLRTMKLIRPVVVFVNCVLRPWCARLWEERVVLRYTVYCQSKRHESPAHQGKRPTFVCLVLVAYPACVGLYMDLFFSMALEILCLVVSAVWGTAQLITIRAVTVPVDEGAWTFGQVLPIFLFVLPLMSFAREVWPIVRSIMSASRGQGARPLDAPLQPMESPRAAGETHQAQAISTRDSRTVQLDMSTPDHHQSTYHLAQFLRRDTYSTHQHIRTIVFSFLASIVLLSGLLLSQINEPTADMAGIKLIGFIVIVFIYQVHLMYFFVLSSTVVSFRRILGLATIEDNPEPAKYWRGVTRRASDSVFPILAPVLYLFLLGCVCWAAIFPQKFDRITVSFAEFGAPSLFYVGLAVGLVRDCKGFAWRHRDTP